MRVTLLNATNESIVCRCSAGHDLIVIPSTTIDLPDPSTRLSLSPLNSLSEKAKQWSIHPEGLAVRVSTKLNASWQAIPVSGICPWLLYISRITRNHHRLVILPRRNLSSFLSEMPDDLPLSSLCLPGTHDTLMHAIGSMAFYGWPISQCQALSTPLAVQLRSGIRILDVRLAIVNSRLIAYHGIYPQRTPFQEILSTIYEFLAAPSTCRETIIMSIKQEDFAKNSPAEFSRLVHEEIFSGAGRETWFLYNRIPALGEVRGKVVLFSRFGGDGKGWDGGLEGLGIHPLIWPDSEKCGFSWQCKNTLIRTHDWYNVPSFLSIPEKVSLATQVLLPPPNDPPFPTLAISFFSAASFPFAFPPTIAKGFGIPKWGLGFEGVNSRFGKWLLDFLSVNNTDSLLSSERGLDGPRIRGWVFVDFYTDPESGLIPLLIECNYRGRRTEEEGWPL